MKKQKWLTTLVLTLTATMVLAACTNDDEEPCEEQVVVQACVG